MRQQRATWHVRIAIVGVLLGFASAILLAGRVHAQAESEGATPVGTWFVSAGTPTIKFALTTYHADGAVTSVVSPARGGPLAGGESADHGTWRRHGRVFESATYRFNYDPDTGGAFFIVRIRTVFTLDAGFDGGSGHFFITQWTCPTPLSCPDPNVAAPDFPEFALPGNEVTMTRARVR